jgi:2-hydroxychromene-2-carboxylate isomerase
MVATFSLNWDYRCPFARNAHEHVVTALEAGAEWEVEFLPYSLTQGHLEEGDVPVWEDPDRARDLLAVEAGIVVRDRHPEQFRKVHLALFRARHDQGRDLRQETELRAVLNEAGADPEEVLQAIAEGWPRESFRKAHESSEATHDVWGVPTFIVDRNAAFVRLMSRPGPDPADSVRLIQRVVDTIGDWGVINELKHTTLDR